MDEEQKEILARLKAEEEAQAKEKRAEMLIRDLLSPYSDDLT